MRYLVLLAMLPGILYGEMAHANNASLRDKIGQMLIIGFNGKEIDNHSPVVKAINNENIGGVILFDYDYQTHKFDRNIDNPVQVKKLNEDLQHAAQKANASHHRPELPLLISIDYEGGQVTRLREDYGFPATIPAAEIGKKSLIEARHAAETMANTLQDAGFNLDFAPILDVDVNPENPVIGKKKRSFSEDPATVANYAAVFSTSFLNHGIQCAYKHFPGHGSSTTDSHVSFVDVSNTWDNKELFPYLSLLEDQQHCGMVMTAHIVNRQLDDSGLPATLSYKMLTGVLREQLSFEGVIITDDMQMKAISDHYKLAQSVTLAINAGVDMLIFGNQLSEKPQDPKQVIDIIESKVMSGEISQSRIEDAYQHIVTFKQTLKR
ncbi:glycoside hydrolase family 3 N-terminal domain-containing protein [Legionella spiritensis]|uniref:beta-N-acetylhexosaminidase n=1 Tax=Legionella spiritensis TaxID=452 RepID=A0A0W0YY79_LEGSP|nr:glycoside hydrolase family 3 N-terminal domain-containing protein [Legionella spiritensis]KTD61841.1 N-acetyl-beta-glucosaminidase [Legionella spiritensis]SNV31597.1 N-acetyl-beta-glucosaminidase [Legionella spiritensis]